MPVQSSLHYNGNPRLLQIQHESLTSQQHHGGGHNGLLVDLSIFGGIIVAFYAIPPLVRNMNDLILLNPTTINVLNRVARFPASVLLNANQLKARVVQVYERHTGKQSFIRYAAINLFPNNFFGPVPRIYVFANNFGRQNPKIIPPPGYLQYVAQEEIDEDGNIIAFAKNSDTESNFAPCDDFTDGLDEYEDEWNENENDTFNSVTQFDESILNDTLTKCSTPKKGMPPKIHFNTFTVNTINDSMSMTGLHSTISDQRVAQLEQEMNDLKSQIALLMQLKGGNDDLQQCDVKVKVVKKDEFYPPPPPPPPPPVLPSFPLFNSEPPAIKLRIGRKSSSEQELLPLPQKPATMSDVLKGLSAVKLKSIPRSPGGTPFKKVNSSNECSPNDIVAALKKRFAVIHGESENDDTENEDDKENNFDDSFESSPIQSHPRADMLRPIILFNGDLTQTKRKSTTPRRSNVENTNFGQHLLKKKILRASAVKQQNENLSPAPVQS